MADQPPPTTADLNEAQRYAASRSHVKKDPELGRLVAFEQLVLKLTDASVLYESGELQNQRDAVAISLMAVESFLRLRGIAPITVRPLMRVLSVLAERENNIHDPLFCERRRASRPKASLEAHQKAGILAALANHWLKHHRDTTRPQKEQFGQIARELQRGNLGEITAPMIKQARELVSREARDHPARSMNMLVEGWLKEASDKFGVKDAIRIILPIIAQSEQFRKN